MTALDIIAKTNHIDDYVEEMNRKDGGVTYQQLINTLVQNDENEDDVAGLSEDDDLDWFYLI